MEGTGTRWLVTLCLLIAVAQCLPSRVASPKETDSEDSRRVLGSSVVTSVSVIMDHGNGTKTYFTDGQSKNVHKPTDTIIGSPGNLLSPDRYEFYTFDETGDLVKRLMTLDEIHGLIAGADPESVIADASPTYYHDALSSHSSEALMHLPASDLESLDAPAVHRVLESVQNVLKNEMAANSGRPPVPSAASHLNRPDSASAWSSLFPGLIETPDDVAHLSSYLLPSKTTESVGNSPLLKKPVTSTKGPSLLTSFQQSSPPPMIKIQSTTGATERPPKPTPKYTTVKPEFTTAKLTQLPTTLKPSTAKKPFRPVQTFDKLQKPTLQKPVPSSRPTSKPSVVVDTLEINKEMSASISDMLSQVTDSQSSNHKPLQTNALVEKDNTADYVPEESSPELSYYSPMAAVSSSTTGALKPIAEALTLPSKRPHGTVAYKATTTEMPFSQKTVSSTATRFGPAKNNVTKLRPTNVTTASYVTKPYNKYNGTTTASTTRNNYQYPPSNMSTKYMQKITQTTQAYPNKFVDSFVKVANKTINNATLSVKQPTETFWNATEDVKNKFTKEPVKVFPNKVTSVRPIGINRTNVTLSNRVQELKTTAVPNYGSSTTTVRSQTEPDKFVSVKVEEWPMIQYPTAQHPTVSPWTTPYASTEKSFFTGNSQQLNAITDANTIRDLISSLMTKSTTTTSSVSTNTASPTTVSAVQTLTAAVSTTLPTPSKPVTSVPASMISSTTDVTATTLSTITTAETTMTTAAATTGTEMLKAVVEAAELLPTTLVNTTAASTTASTTPASTSAAITTEASTTVASTTAASTTAASTTAASTTAASTTAASTTTMSTTTSTTTASTTTASTAVASKTTASATASMSTTAASSTTTGSSTTAASTASRTPTTPTDVVTSTTPESETQYVPVTHFLPELQVKDRLDTENNNSSNVPGMDSMLKDGISAVANMLQNTVKPPVALSTEYQLIGRGPYETTVLGEVKQSSTEQTRKQATVKSDFSETTTIAVSEDSTTAQEPYEFTTTARLAEPNDTIAMESGVTANRTEYVFRTSEPGAEMLTVFNVSSMEGSGQGAKIAADLSAETRIDFDTTAPYENNIVTTIDPIATDEPTIFTTFSPVATTVTIPTTTTTTMPTTTTTTTTTTSTTTAADIQNVTYATTPSHPPAVKSPGPSSNAYRPLANSASPSTVELHPAPHESMGLEASVAFLGDDVRRFADLCNELSFKMWTAVTSKGQIGSRSLVLSPFELTAMLAMVFLGARGSTSGQMNDVLRLDDMVTFNPHQVLRNITHSITNVNNPGVATASFVREIYSNKGNGKILDFYKERVQQYYDGHVEEVDFNTIGDVLRRRTNLLVKRQTLGRVVEYLRGSGLSLTPPFAAFSANVFQTSCEGASTEGRDGEMYFVVRPSTRQRRLVPVPSAVWRGGFLAGYEPGLDATAVCLSPDSAVSTILVLPGQQGQVAPGDGLARLEQRLIETSYRRGGWSRILRSLLPRPGLELQVPRFSHRSVLNTTAALQKMGLKDVFSGQKADLRGVNGLYDLYLSDMLQVNTFSTCGEDAIGARHHVETYPASPQRMGRVEMLAERRRRKRYATADDFPLYSPYSHLPLSLRPRQARLPDVPRLRFDRPFLYLVRHNPTGMIVYLGRFNPRLLP